MNLKGGEAPAGRRKKRMRLLLTFLVLIVPVLVVTVFLLMAPDSDHKMKPPPTPDTTTTTSTTITQQVFVNYTLLPALYRRTLCILAPLSLTLTVTVIYVMVWRGKGDQTTDIVDPVDPVPVDDSNQSRWPSVFTLCAITLSTIIYRHRRTQPLSKQQLYKNKLIHQRQHRSTYHDPDQKPPIISPQEAWRQIKEERAAQVTTLKAKLADLLAAHRSSTNAGALVRLGCIVSDDPPSVQVRVRRYRHHEDDNIVWQFWSPLLKTTADFEMMTVSDAFLDAINGDDDPESPTFISTDNLYRLYDVMDDIIDALEITVDVDDLHL